ncbi:MAG: GxxExxY protein [Muribaculaceae bacterium]|jgi:GxxExxY protein|nr:GxxExxY protein [Muribaculaceae bacterium]
MVKYLYQDETYAIRGCLRTVAFELGSGFLEKVYQEALELEFKEAGIPFQREVKLPIFYKGKSLQQEYFADFVCYGKIIVELKAVSQLNEIHEAQVLNYLKATGFDVALLVNFGETPVKIKRLFNFMKK